MTWLLFKILDWFERGPQPSASVVEKLKKENAEPPVDIYGRIRDSSHTPTTKSANNEPIEHDRVEYENQKDTEQTQQLFCKAYPHGQFEHAARPHYLRR